MFKSELSYLHRYDALFIRALTDPLNSSYVLAQQAELLGKRVLDQELRLHLGDRTTGYVFPSPRGEHYNSRRLQQLFKELAAKAGIGRMFIRTCCVTRLRSGWLMLGCQRTMLQKFLGQDNPKTTQVYYEPARVHVKAAFEEAMQK